jgi:hypothetical protein
MKCDVSFMIFVCVRFTEQWHVTIADIGSEFLGAFRRLRKATISFVISVCVCVFSTSPWDSSTPTGRIFIKFKI